MRFPGPVVLGCLAGFISACQSTPNYTPGDLSRELTLLVADVEDAALVIDDPELQDELAAIVDDLEDLAQIVASAEAGAAKPMAEQVLALTDAVLAMPGLTTDAKLAVVGVRAILRRVIAAS